MDDEQLQRQIEQLASAAVDASRAHSAVGSGAPPKPPRSRVLVAALVVLLVLGGVILAGLRRVDTSDVSTRPGPVGTLGTTSPSPSYSVTIVGVPATSPQPGATSLSPFDGGTEIFRHTSPDGRIVLVGRRTDPGASCEPPLGSACGSGEPLLIVIQSFEGQSMGGSGGSFPKDPSPDAIAARGQSIGSQVRDVTFGTSPVVARVTIDLLQRDGSVATDEMVPVQGVVAFGIDVPNGFVGPARAYGADGMLLGSADVPDPPAYGPPPGG